MADFADNSYNEVMITGRFSRMRRLEEKRNLRRAVLFFLAIVLTIAGLLTVGFSLLAGLFDFLGDWRSRTDPTAGKSDFIPPGPPQLATPFEATNSASFSLRGIAEQGTMVYLSQNEAEIKNLVVPEGGIFEFSGINLDIGTNIFAAVAVDEAGNRSQVSSKLAVEYSTTPPKIELESPADRQTFSGKDIRITVKGKTDPGVRVSINDRVAIVGANGGFQLQLGLNPGDNPLVIVAINSAGNKERKEISVVYNP